MKRRRRKKKKKHLTKASLRSHILNLASFALHADFGFCNIIYFYFPLLKFTPYFLKGMFTRNSNMQLKMTLGVRQKCNINSKKVNFVVLVIKWFFCFCFVFYNNLLCGNPAGEIMLFSCKIHSDLHNSI